MAKTDERVVVIDPCRPEASNVPNFEQWVAAGRIAFVATKGAPDSGPFYFIRYSFRVETAGAYRLVVESANPGTSRSSRFSVSFDAGKDFPVLRRQLANSVTKAGNWLHEQDPVEFGAGSHTLELRMRPEDRMRNMNRVREPFQGHCIDISGLSLVPVPTEKLRAKAGTIADGMTLCGGESIVLFGDSITEEEYYGRHLDRILRAISPAVPVRVYNSGVSLNRTWEGVDRVERDVIALRPDWVLLAFGVNDSVHMTPSVFAENYALLIERLQKCGIKVVCATPSGMCADPIQDGRWFHTPDRARGFDRTIACESREIQRLVAASNCPVADVYGAFTRAGFDRKAIMANQWHPNDAGGRVEALAILKAFGADDAAIARSGDAKDIEAWTGIKAMPAVSYPALDVKPVVNRSVGRSLVVAASFTQNAVYAFDDVGALLACVPVGAHPMGLAWNAVAGELYVSNEGNGTLSVIAVPAFKVRKTVVLGDVYPNGLAVSGDGRTLWSANFFGSSLVEIDTATWEIRRTVGLNSLGNAVAVPAGTASVVVLAGGEAIFVNSGDGDILKRAKVSNYAAAFYTDVAGVLHAVDTGDWKRSAVDVATMAVKPSGTAPFPARALCLAADGSVLAGDCEHGRIVKVRPGAEPVWFAEVEFALALMRIVLPAEG